VGVGLTDGERDILLFASNGKTVRFGEDKVRSMGRTATGVRGIKMPKGEEVVSLIVAESAGGSEDENEDESQVDETVIDSGDAVIENGADDDNALYILTATENGYGKRTPLPDYPRKGRGTQGVIGIQTTERNGKLVRAVLMGPRDEVLLISDGGTLVRTRGSEISRVGRNTQGVTLIRLSKEEKLQAVERMDASLDEGVEEEAPAAVEASPVVAPPEA
jgi:DNA gyrase subunit A